MINARADLDFGLVPDRPAGPVEWSLGKGLIPYDFAVAAMETRAAAVAAGLDAALADGRATLRILGKRHPVTLTKVDDPAVTTAVRDVAVRKYPARPDGDVWLFAVTSRSS